MTGAPAPAATCPVSTGSPYALTSAGAQSLLPPVRVHPLRHKPVYEIKAGQPSWSRLSRLASEHVAQLATRSIVHAVKTYGRLDCEPSLLQLRTYLREQLSAAVVRQVLAVCLAKDRYLCHHNHTDCLALEYWRVFFDHHQPDIAVVHHEFAFPKTTNYPEIVHNLERLLALMSQVPATSTSFKLELKHCEIGFLLERQVWQCLPQFAELRVLALPELASDKLLPVIAHHCTKLEVLNLRGCRGQITDEGFTAFIETAQCRERLRNLDLSRCSLTDQILLPLQRLVALSELKVSTTMLDDISFSCDGQAVLLQLDTGETWSLGQMALPSVRVVRVENDGMFQISINKVMTYLRTVFPKADNIQLENCVACELHVTLTQYPTNITFMRETIHTLELNSADYFNFPRLVYPCPNLESLAIDKPTNDVFNIDQQHVPFLYGNTVPFINLKNLKLSRISLTNLSHFLSKSRNLKKFKVTNIGRRERPRWTDQRILQIFPVDSVPFLEYFHVSCLPTEGFSTITDTHRYLHLTKATVQYLTENFSHLLSIAGVESWSLNLDSNVGSLNAMLNHNNALGKQFNVISI
ncbi:uncharacterized protein LOC131883266 [Tigriopus californicus]|uniref:uncharacterized protein LOC131883266 n=1 Tax=Tigriopus californicus TaxID=6832 RepID=UPI0027DA93B0|nr:uncharacterized protein LOC131883266 [Tigriopus californicus]